MTKTHYKPRMKHESSIWEYIAYATLVVGAGVALYIQGKFKPTDINVNVTIQSRKSPSVEKLVEIPDYEPTNGVVDTGYPYSNNGKDSLPIATAISSNNLEGKVE